MNLLEEKSVISIDLGATSGRIMKVSVRDGKYHYTEIKRFKNFIIQEDGRLYWDIDNIINIITNTIKHIDFPYESIGISTWGCDFCLIDENNQLIRKPLCYRDEQIEEVFNELDYNLIYEKTGIQKLAFNTIYQLYYLRKNEEEIYKRTKSILMIPDYIAFVLTGCKYLELTNLSTTALYNPNTKLIDQDLLNLINFDRNKFPDILKPKEIYGYLYNSTIPVIATCTHDTGSAIFGSLAKNDSLYLSSGTWSLMGTLSDDPFINQEIREANYTNEIGYGGKIRFLKNIIGMWILEEYRKELEKSNIDNSFKIIYDELRIEPQNLVLIDPDHPLFKSPGNMTNRINEFARITNQSVPESRQEYLHCIYYSLAFKYKYTFEIMKKLTNKNYEFLNIIGGGSQNDVFSQIISNIINLKIILGPVEATVIGNAGVQFIALNLISEEDHYNLINNSNLITIFPKDSKITKYYNKFLKILEVSKNGSSN